MSIILLFVFVDLIIEVMVQLFVCQYIDVVFEQFFWYLFGLIVMLEQLCKYGVVLIVKLIVVFVEYFGLDEIKEVKVVFYFSDEVYFG